jgi:prepilin-type N-terminal cleavage/methylation domain-containing protein
MQNREFQSSHSFDEPRCRAGFTLIELLIVVAIIAILAAIAVPNFMEAQTRSKVSRTKSDMRSLATAIESYAVDTNNYPPAYGLNVDGRDSIAVLSTPIAYISAGPMFDPFVAGVGKVSKTLLTYEVINHENKIIEVSAKKAPSTTWVSPYTSDGKKAVWWWLASRGPNRTFDGWAKTDTITMEQAFFESDTAQGVWLGMVYDATNGTISRGNIYRGGGQVTGFAGQTMMH